MLQGAAVALRFSEDGRVLWTATFDGRLQTWNVATLKNTTTLEISGNPGSVRSNALSSDGNKLSRAMTNEIIEPWQVAPQKRTTTFGEEEPFGFYTTAFSPDDKAPRDHIVSRDGNFGGDGVLEVRFAVRPPNKKRARLLGSAREQLLRRNCRSISLLSGLLNPAKRCSKKIRRGAGVDLVCHGSKTPAQSRNVPKIGDVVDALLQIG